MVSSGKSIKEASEKYDINYFTAKSICKVYRDEGR